jgi:predicted signal transduction protein with EAL and GGDEF domain
VISRLGGDEFALVVGDLDGEAAVSLGSALRRSLEAPVVIGAEEVGVGASVGFAVATAAEALQTEALLARADLAMYAAKNSDHGPRQWEARLESPGAQKVPLLADLRKAVQDGAVVVWVQPQVDARDGRLLGVEALARWDHPELGEVPPTTFVAVAERGGLMAQLTAHVLEQSLVLVSGWSRAGLRIPISVNVSPRNVNQHFVADVARLLARYDVDPALVTLELTETSVMLDPERATAVLAELKTLGLRLSVDDFGTGWSSLAQLQRHAAGRTEDRPQLRPGPRPPAFRRRDRAQRARPRPPPRHDDRRRGRGGRGDADLARRRRVRPGAGLPRGPADAPRGPGGLGGAPLRRRLRRAGRDPDRLGSRHSRLVRRAETSAP